MGKSWDNDKGGRDQWITWLSEIMREALRVTRPGGHAFIWALPRTAYMTGYALAKAGWEVRDCISHFQGADTLTQNFLSSLNHEQIVAFEMLLESKNDPSVCSHLFGSGFPKSHNVAKAVEAEIINQLQQQGIEFTGWEDEDE